MKKSNIVSCGITLALSVGLVVGMSACSSKQVAATAGDTKIYEEDITAYIENFRANQDLTDDTAWASWMNSYGYTPETVRSEVVDMYAQEALVAQACKERGISVDSATIDQYVNTMKANYSDDASWKEALETAGLTESEYRTKIEESLLQQQLKAQVTEGVEASDEDTLSIASLYSYYYDGARKSSHILFGKDDEALAWEVLQKLQNNEISFEDAVAQYSTDEGSKADAGNVGWDCMTTFVTEYQTALDGLEKGQMSTVVSSDYGFHIILCTDVFNRPEELTSLDELPEDFIEVFRNYAKSNAATAAYNEWMTSYKEEKGVVLNDMPAGLSYAVDMSAYTIEDEAAEGTSEATGEAATQGTTTDESASGTEASDASSEANTESNGETSASN